MFCGKVSSNEMNSLCVIDNYDMNELANLEISIPQACCTSNRQTVLLHLLERNAGIARQAYFDFIYLKIDCLPCACWSNSMP